MFRFGAPAGAPATCSRLTGGAHWPSRGSCLSSFELVIVSSSPCVSFACSRQRFALAAVYPDRLVQPRQVENLLVVLVEAVRQQLLLLAVGADQQRDQQADARTVHVLQPAEVQHDCARAVAA